MERAHTTVGQPLILYSLVCLLVLGLGTARGGTGETPRTGGTLRMALPQPGSLDLQWRAPTFYTWVITPHYLETLYTWGQDWGPTPMLAEGHTVSDDGLVYTFKLRRGVLFHNGKELTAADVVASLRRWGRTGIWGKELFRRVESVQPLDKYTVQLRLQEQYAVVLPLLWQGVIYPQEVVDRRGMGR
jgi:peptide/nickel transport system substrate-binding protein